MTLLNMTLLSKEGLITIAIIAFVSYYIHPNKVNINIFLLNIQNSIHKYIDTLYFLFSEELFGDSPDYEESISVEDEDEDEEDDTNNKKVLEEIKPELKYEDKYLEQLRKLSKDYIFNEEESAEEERKFNEIFTTLNNNYKTEIDNLNKRSVIIESIFKNDNQDDENEKLLLLEEYNSLIDQLNKLLNINLEEQKNEFMVEAKEEARKYIINEKLNKLKDCFIMEKTPLGNVLMFYNHKREAFEFYSDNTIPYRYLEPVGRKYVKTFNCRPIFVDMEEELRLCEERIETERLEKERLEKEKEALRLSGQNNANIVDQKKNVFAKFKSYNKEAGTGRVNTVAPPKNSIPNKPVTEKESTEKVLLKENANHYKYEGKLSNFNFLKKVDRKVVDKKFALTFADFKQKFLLESGNNK